MRKNGVYLKIGVNIQYYKINMVFALERISLLFPFGTFITVMQERSENVFEK